VLADYNDIESTKRFLTRDVAAIIVEPMQAAGGMIPADRDFLAFLRQGATDTGAVLIFDEVVTSRLHFGGLQMYHGISPDITTLGKWIGGGFSFGAFGGRDEIMARLDPRTKPADGGVSHPGTFNNNVFSMAAGAAACRVLTAKAIQRINELGEILRSRIRALLHNQDVAILQLSGFGSLTGLHFSGPDSATLRDLFFFHMLHQGIYVGKRGFLNLTVVHEQRHVDQVVAATAKFINLYL
jgi:glutamate-1-semialdehyde 2,1-aminomutase